MGVYLPNKISGRPVTHLFLWVNKTSELESALRTNPGGSGMYKIEFDPVA